MFHIRALRAISWKDTEMDRFKERPCNKTTVTYLLTYSLTCVIVTFCTIERIILSKKAQHLIHAYWTRPAYSHYKFLCVCFSLWTGLVVPQMKTATSILAPSFPMVSLTSSSHIMTVDVSWTCRSKLFSGPPLTCTLLQSFSRVAHCCRRAAFLTSTENTLSK